MKIIYFFLSTLMWTSCLSDKSTQDYNNRQYNLTTDKRSTKNLIIKEENTITTRIKAPSGFDIDSTEAESYAHYLQSLPLRPKGSKIRYFDGRTKSYFTEFEAVIDLPIGTKDLHQCADAVMRLRADYLWHSGQYEKIHFNFTNGMRVDYEQWMAGNRIKVNVNKTEWYQAKEASNTHLDYWQYLEQIWMYAGTLSLEKELKSRSINNVQIGDIFIQGGSPGHAITIVNKATNNDTGEQLILLAQSYMPAQELHILKTPNNTYLSPWYSIKNLQQLVTPEWTFDVSDLKHFEY